MRSRARYLLTLTGLPLRARVGLLWRAAVGRFLPPGPPLILRIGEARLLLDPDDEGDIAAFDDVFSKQVYRTDYRGATVLDIGAHKGYFVAYAVLGGAAGVHAFEPEPRNFDALMHAARSLRGSVSELVVRRRAVTATDGEGELLVAGESWGHSLFPGPEQGIAGVRRVRTRRFERVLDRARKSAGPTGRLIAKIDAEGCECEIVLDTPVSTLGRLSELFLELHPFAPCDEHQILEQLHSAGFEMVSRRDDVIHLKKGPADSRQQGLPDVS